MDRRTAGIMRSFVDEKCWGPRRWYVARLA